jgi:hypothetical protein
MRISRASLLLAVLWTQPLLAQEGVGDVDPLAPPRAGSAAPWTDPAPREEVTASREAPPPARHGLRFDPRDGLVFEEPSAPLVGSILVRPRVLLSLDYRCYDERNARASQARLDRALVGIEGVVAERITFRVLADPRGIDTDYALEEAWAAVDVYETYLRLSGGLLRFTPGVEHSFAEETLPWIDYGFPGQLTGRHDLGLLLEGEVADGLLSYQVGAGGGAGFDHFGQRRGEPFLMGKAMLYPFRWLDLDIDVGPYSFPVLSGLFFSGAVSWSWDFLGNYDAATPLRNELFSTPLLRADRTFAWHIGYGVDLGPLRVIHEIGRLDLIDAQLPDGTERDLRGNQNTAWSLGLSWRITGEPYDSRLYRQRGRLSPDADGRLGAAGFPQRPLLGPGSAEQRSAEWMDIGPSGEAWGIGTVEVAVRYMNSERDRRLFDQGVTSEAVSSQEFRAFDVAVNWWPVRTFRATFHLTRTIADGDLGVFGGGGRDTSFAMRFQLDF